MLKNRRLAIVFALVATLQTVGPIILQKSTRAIVYHNALIGAVVFCLMAAVIVAIWQAIWRQFTIVAVVAFDLGRSGLSERLSTFGLNWRSVPSVTTNSTPPHASTKRRKPKDESYRNIAARCAHYRGSYGSALVSRMHPVPIQKQQPALSKATY